MKIILAGIGKVGSSLTRHLTDEEYDLTLVDVSSEKLNLMMERCDVISVTGNCATMGVLKQAGVESAELLIAMTGEDEVNLLCCMTAHSMNPQIHTIARIRNPEYTEQIYAMRNSFGLSMTVNPEKRAALAIERLLKFPGFLKRESFAKDRVEIVELKVSEDSPLNGISLYEMNSITKCQVLVCVVQRGTEVTMPKGDFILKKDDHILVTAATNELTTLLANLKIITHKVKRVMIAGGDRISFYLAERLLKSGIAVEIIEKNYERCELLATRLPDANIIHGDATNHQILVSEGISECDALISLTGFDEMNIVISLYGSNDGVPQVITKLGHKENSNILNQLPIGSIACPRELCCDSIVRYVRAVNNQTGAAVSIHSLAKGKAEAAEFVADENTKNIDTPLKKLKFKKNVLISCISHKGKTVIPNGDSKYQLGDTVIVISPSTTVLNTFNDIFD